MVQQIFKYLSIIHCSWNIFFGTVLGGRLSHVFKHYYLFQNIQRTFKINIKKIKYNLAGPNGRICSDWLLLCAVVQQFHFQCGQKKYLSLETFICLFSAGLKLP